MTGAPLPDGWDDGVLSLGGHFLQSSAWARVQERLGYEVVHAADRDWCWLGVLGRAGPLRYLYLPFGPTLRSAPSLARAIDSARSRARAHGCAVLVAEPDAVESHELRALRGREIAQRQHRHTLRLRLDVDEAALRGGLNRGHRSRINTAAKRGLAVEMSTDPAAIDSFLPLLRETEKRSGFFSHDDSYYRAIAEELLPTGVGSLYFATAEGRRVAGALVFDFGDTRYYAFAASGTEDRALMPAPPLVWRTILDAREKGLRWYDFWGIAPPDEPGHAWRGITEFKRGFGGEVHSRAGTWEFPVRRLRAGLLRAGRALRR